MHARGDHDLPSWDAQGGGDAEGDPDDELEAAIEQADRPFASESFGLTNEEAEAGESLDRRLAQERPDRLPDEDYVALEDAGEGDEELVGGASPGHDVFVAPRRPPCGSGSGRRGRWITTRTPRSTRRADPVGRGG